MFARSVRQFLLERGAALASARCASPAVLQANKQRIDQFYYLNPGERTALAAAERCDPGPALQKLRGFVSELQLVARNVSDHLEPLASELKPGPASAPEQEAEMERSVLVSYWARLGQDCRLPLCSELTTPAPAVQIGFGLLAKFGAEQSPTEIPAAAVLCSPDPPTAAGF